MKKISDERLFRINHEILSRNYYFFLLMISLGAVLKYMIGEREGSSYYLEAVSLAGSLGYILFHGAAGCFFLKGRRDERLRQEESQSLAWAFWWCFWIYVLGNFLYFLIYRNDVVSAVNLGVFLIADMAVVLPQFKRGVLASSVVLGRKENHGEDQFKKLKISSFIGGTFFGVFMLWEQVRCGPAFSTFSLEKVGICAGGFVLYGLFFGCFWYFCMKMLMVWAQRRSEREGEEKGDGE